MCWNVVCGVRIRNSEKRRVARHFCGDSGWFWRKCWTFTSTQLFIKEQYIVYNDDIIWLDENMYNYLIGLQIQIDTGREIYEQCIRKRTYSAVVVDRILWRRSMILTSLDNVTRRVEISARRVEIFVPSPVCMTKQLELIEVIKPLMDSCESVENKEISSPTEYTSSPIFNSEQSSLTTTTNWDVYRRIGDKRDQCGG